MTPAVAWQVGRMHRTLDAELRGAAALFWHTEQRRDAAPAADVLTVPAERLEDLEALCARLRRERDRVPGQLVLFPERRAA